MPFYEINAESRKSKKNDNTIGLYAFNPDASEFHKDPSMHDYILLVYPSSETIQTIHQQI